MMLNNDVHGRMATREVRRHSKSVKTAYALVKILAVTGLMCHCASQNPQQSSGVDDVISGEQTQSANQASNQASVSQNGSNDNSADQNTYSQNSSNQNGGNTANSTAAANAASNNAVIGGSAENFAASNGVTNSTNSATLNSDVADYVPDVPPVNSAVGNTNMALPLNSTNMVNGKESDLSPVAPINGLPQNAAQSPVNTAKSSPSTPDLASTAGAVQNMSSSPGVLKWVGYNYRKDERKLEIQVVTEGSPTYRLFQETNRAGQTELVARFLNTSMRQKIRRDIDATEFRSPVAYIRMRHNPSFKHTDVIMTMRDTVQPLMVAKGSNLMFTFEIPEHWFAPKDAANPVASAEVIKDDALGLPVSVSEIPADGTKKNAAYNGNPGGDVFGGTGDAGVPLVPKSQTGKELVPAGSPASPRTPEAGHQLLQNSPSPFLEVSYQINGVAQADFSADIPLASPGSDLLEDAPAEAFQTAESLADGAELVGVNSGSTPVVSKKKVLRLEFRDAPVSQIIKMIANESGINFLISPEAGVRKTSISFKNLPWDVALKAILESNRLGMQEIAPGLVRVDFLETFTKDRDAEEKARQATEALIPTKVLVMPLNYAKADDAAKLAQAMLPKVSDQSNLAEKRNIDRFKVISDPRSNSVIVEATPNVLSTIKVLLERLDAQTPQVRIASRLVEITNDIGDGLGVAFSTPFSMDPGRGLGFGTLPFPNSLTSQFSVDPGGGDVAKGGTAAIRLGSINNLIALDLKLKAYETRRKAETLQNQDVVVQDNEKATVSAGRTDYLQTTAGVGSSGTLATVEYDLSLQVTPHITADGSVQMKLDIKGDSPNSSDIKAGQVSKNTRLLSTTLLKKSGETAVIGGLYSSQVGRTEAAVPFFSKLPIIGALFRSVDNSDNKKDLLIMVTPTIIGSASGAPGGAAGDIVVPPTNAAAGNAANAPVATNQAPSQNGDFSNGQASQASLESN